MKITRSQLKNLIKEELKESLSGHQSEISYSHTNPPESKKALQRNYWKAHRGPAARADIESQVASMDTPETDQRTLGDILPIPREEWESYSAIGVGDAPSKKLSYLYGLARDIAKGRKGGDISHDDIEMIGELVYNQFGFDWVRMIVRQRGDWRAQARSEELEHYDHGDDPSNIREAQHKMKITRSQLKNLIKEEMSRITSSNNPPSLLKLTVNEDRSAIASLSDETTASTVDGSIPQLEMSVAPPPGVYETGYLVFVDDHGNQRDFGINITFEDGRTFSYRDELRYPKLMS
jgi:hypothetical protein